MTEGQGMYELSDMRRFVSISPWQGVGPKVWTERVTCMHQRYCLAAFEGGRLIRQPCNVKGQFLKASNSSSRVRAGMQRLQRMCSKSKVQSNQKSKLTRSRTLSNEYPPEISRYISRHRSGLIEVYKQVLRSGSIQ